MLPFCRDHSTERRCGISPSRLFGAKLAIPVGIAPTGLAGLFWPDGECAAARAAAAAGTFYCASHGSACTLEDIAATGTSPRWMQVFVYTDRGFTREMVDRAKCLRIRRAGAYHRQSDARQPRARHPQRLCHPAALRRDRDARGRHQGGVAAAHAQPACRS